jgi:hypothetical protein
MLLGAARLPLGVQTKALACLCWANIHISSLGLIAFRPKRVIYQSGSDWSTFVGSSFAWRSQKTVRILTTSASICVHAIFSWVLSVDAKPAVCVSIVNTVQSSVRQISSVYGSSNAATPLLKFITGVHLSQDFDWITGLCGMVFNLPLMHVQLNMSVLTFGTRGITINKYGQSYHSVCFIVTHSSRRATQFAR